MKRTDKKNSSASLSEIAFEKIKARIVSLAIRPGEQVDETSTAQTLGIGRTPIRESLFRLASEGLLDFRAGRGFFVRDITLDVIKDLFETLLILERPAVVLAARRIRAPAITRLKSLNIQLENAWNRHHYLDVTLSNSRFHREIYVAAGNEFMGTYLNSLQTQSQRLAYICFTRPTAIDLAAHAEASIVDHAQLIHCLEKKDETGAVELVTRHIQRFQRRVTDYTAAAPIDLALSV